MVAQTFLTLVILSLTLPGKKELHQTNGQSSRQSHCHEETYDTFGFPTFKNHGAKYPKDKRFACPPNYTCRSANTLILSIPNGGKCFRHDNCFFQKDAITLFFSYKQRGPFRAMSLALHRANTRAGIPSYTIVPKNESKLLTNCSLYIVLYRSPAD